MATYNLTAKSTAGVGANQTGVPRQDHSTAKLKHYEGYLDIAKLTAAGATIATGDVFNVLKVPAGFLILNAGAEVMTAFNGTSPTVDIDFAGGDDIVDGASVASAGYLASGTNGQTNVIRGDAASTYTEFNATEDTIDVTLAVTGNPTVGVLRVYVQGIDCGEQGGIVPTEVTRDQLA